MSDGRGRWAANLRRALFMRRLRRLREEETPPGSAPRLSLPARLLLRRMLRHPERPRPLGPGGSAYQIPYMNLVELGEDLAAANLAFLKWIDGRRYPVLTEVGAAELPGILVLYQSTRPLPVLLRHGPRAAGRAWLLGHRERRWRRRRKSGHDDRGLLW